MEVRGLGHFELQHHRRRNRWHQHERRDEGAVRRQRLHRLVDRARLPGTPSSARSKLRCWSAGAMATSGHVTVTFFAVLSGVSMCSSRSAAPRIQRSRFAPAGSYQVLDGFALDGCRRDLELEVRRMVCSQFRRSSSPGLAVLVDDARCLQRVLTVELVHVVPASLRPGWVIKRVTDVALRARPFAFVARRGWRGGGLCRPDQGLVAV